MKTCLAMVEVLLSLPKCDVNKGQGTTTPLHLCARNGFEDVTKLIFKYHPHVTTSLRDDSGRTAGEVARQSGHPAVADVIDLAQCR